MILNSEKFKHYFDRFSRNDEETVIQYVDNRSAWAWMKDQMPYFECPDKELEETYYFRWWVYRKHIKQTPKGFIITEFHPDVYWAGKYNSINCAAGHHLNEGRWLKNREEFLTDYILFWLRKGGSPRSYSTWLADAIWNYCSVVGDFSLAVELLPDLAKNYAEWENSNLNGSGLFWSYDDRDAMEISISGSGLRPTLNSYLYADAIAIAKIAALAGKKDTEDKFSGKAAILKKLVQERLWDEDAEFFKVIPLEHAKAPVPDWNFKTINPDHNVREQIGFIPWYFNLPDKGYEAAWKQLMDEEGFYAPFGPTTAERRHPSFMFHYGHECLWNGPSWPFATAQTLTALANLLNNYEQSFAGKQDYFDTLKTYAKCHYRTKSDGGKVSWIDENIDPFTGRWLSRDILENWDWKQEKGGYERGKDYNHSTFCDLIITGLMGLRVEDGKDITVNPLVPDGLWDYFCLDNVPVRGKIITILYDRTGEKYGKGKGLHVFADGVEQ
jgi:hypothetical protein